MSPGPLILLGYQLQSFLYLPLYGGLQKPRAKETNYKQYAHTNSTPQNRVHVIFQDIIGSHGNFVVVIHTMISTLCRDTAYGIYVDECHKYIFLRSAPIRFE